MMDVSKLGRDDKDFYISNVNRAFKWGTLLAGLYLALIIYIVVDNPQGRYSIRNMIMTLYALFLVPASVIGVNAMRALKGKKQFLITIYQFNLPGMFRNCITLFFLMLIAPVVGTYVLIKYYEVKKSMK